MNAPRAEINEFPREIIVDPTKETRSLFLSQQEELIVGHNMVAGYRTVDQAWEHDKLGTLRTMKQSLTELHGEHGFVQAAIRIGAGQQPRHDLAVILSPMNDRGQPHGNASNMLRWVNTPSDQKSFWRRQFGVMPNTWSPLTKFELTHQFAQTQGLAVDHLQIFAREAPAFSPAERRQIAQGITLPYGRLVLDGIREANRRKLMFSGSEAYSRIHLFCAGMGAKALGAARYLQEQTDDVEVASVTVQNLSIGDVSATRHTRAHLTRQVEGAASLQSVPECYERVTEFRMRQAIDDGGAEKLMLLRDGQAAGANPRMTFGLIRGKHSPDYITELLANGVTVTLANSLNEPANAYTERFVPIGDDTVPFHYTLIVGVEGKKTGQAVNEHAGLVATVAALGISNYFNDRKRSA